MDSVISCPKCGYVRKTTDTVPAWQCPSCGIAYNKYHPAAPAAIATPAVATPTVAPVAAAPVGKGDKREPSTTMGRGSAVSCVSVYVVLVLIGLIVTSRRIWLLVLPLLAAASFYYWISAYRRKHSIEDVPTSRIVDAAQGYVELCGTVAPAFGHALNGPITNEPCIWYHYVISEKEDDDKYTTKAHGTASVPFLIQDETGECLVNPDKAELLCDMCQHWEEGNRLYSEWSIRIGDPIIALGRFSTRTPPPAGDPAIEADAVLRSWLADPRGFFTRFDADRDGKIAAPELAKAREAARSEGAQRAAQKAAGLHTLVAPDDGRPFFIMFMAQTEAEEKYRKLAIVHLVTFFIALGFLAYNLGGTAFFAKARLW